MRSIALCRATPTIHARGFSGKPVAMPLFDRARKRFLRRVFREIEVAEHADESREYSPELLTVEALDTGGGVIHRHIHPMAGEAACRTCR